ncbi:MAG: 16S rRNA (adenine(1518)-N(6)/adenine(1519)-N(6))-dimethyltransferase RsmA [Candidatus Paceibacterota bacterium]|jgi:16S rRNA (adenine1518-N6/adenine1519-N6)-dimethyltransferase
MNNNDNSKISFGVHAKKSLGQNFLKSKTALMAIIKAGEVNPSDIILEIGPGKGALTEKILETGAKVIAIEKDDRLIEFLNEKFEKEVKSGRFSLITGDVLEIELSSLNLEPRNYKLIANIPYYITGLIFRKFLEGKIQPSKLVVMVQKEIADRIVARDEKESLLSLSVKCYGEPKKIMKVGKENFSPEPKVDSAILLIDNISKNFFKEITEENFFEVIKAGFAHKRKVLIANLKNIFIKNGKDPKKVFAELKISEKVRAEDLKLGDWKNLIINIY